MQNKNEEEGNTFYNDFSSEEIKQPKKLSQKTIKILIGVTIIFVSIIILAIIIISIILSRNNVKGSYY